MVPKNIISKIVIIKDSFQLPDVLEIAFVHDLPQDSEKKREGYGLPGGRCNNIKGLTAEVRNETGINEVSFLNNGEPIAEWTRGIRNDVRHQMKLFVGIARDPCFNYNHCRSEETAGWQFLRVNAADGSILDNSLPSVYLSHKEILKRNWDVIINMVRIYQEERAYQEEYLKWLTETRK